MNIGLIDVDRLNNRKGKRAYPNLAMMKISAYHKAQGDNVEWYDGFTHYDIVYMSKVFNFTPDYPYPINADQVIKGGTGYDIHSRLSPEIEFIAPDYDLYQVPKDTAYGFITRGCPNKCKWCVVPQKEGRIAPYMDIEDIAAGGRNKVILMDNNILASEYGLSQIQKIVDLGLRVDFNQALDARLVTPEIGKLLARVKWLNIIRFGCDTKGQIAECDRAVELINKYGYRGEYFFYCILIGDEQECLARINHWRDKGHRYMPYAQPYRNPDNKCKITPPQWQRDMARWCNRKELLTTCEYEDYSCNIRNKLRNKVHSNQMSLF